MKILLILFFVLAILSTLSTAAFSNTDLCPGNTNRLPDGTCRPSSSYSFDADRLDSIHGQNIDKTEGFQLVIPEYCKRHGFCEDIPNYPEETVKKVISEILDLDSYKAEKLDVLHVSHITRRALPQEEHIELCQFEEKVAYPKAAMDANQKWHDVLNQDVEPVQGHKMEICMDFTSCSGVVEFVKGYEGRCIQNYVYRNMTVLLNDGSMSEKSLKMPSYCSCVARPFIN